MWTGPPYPVVQIASPSLPAAPHIVVYMMSIRPSVCAVAAHFKQAGHDVSALRYVVVEYVNSLPRRGDHGKRLLQRETFWIYFLNTMSPSGLNEGFDVKPFLENTLGVLCVYIESDI